MKRLTSGLALLAAIGCGGNGGGMDTSITLEDAPVADAGPSDAPRADAPRPRNDAERVIIRGCFALYSERFAADMDALFTRVGLRAPEILALLNGERRDAIELWQAVVELTEGEATAIAWHEHARYRIRQLEAELPAPTPTTVAALTPR